MARCNMIEISQKVKSSIPAQFDIGVAELDQLHQMLQEGKEWEALTTAFNFGYVMGGRSASKGNTVF